MEIAERNGRVYQLKCPRLTVCDLKFYFILLMLEINFIVVF